MNVERTSVGTMPFRRRQDGISAIERHEERELWDVITCFFNFLNNDVINNNIHVPFEIIGLGIQFLMTLMDLAIAIRTCVRNAHPVIDKVSYEVLIKDS
jgi:hypothetical protein